MEVFGGVVVTTPDWEKLLCVHKKQPVKTVRTTYFLRGTNSNLFMGSLFPGVKGNYVYIQLSTLDEQSLWKLSVLIKNFS
jgi:hypothetical protein